MLDLALGIATLVMRRRRALWIAQMALMAGYTLLITVFLPEFWLHPYGPLLKNLPMLAAIAVLLCWRTAEMEYLVAKWLHILSSTLLFGTGLGSAYYMLLTSLHARRARGGGGGALRGARGLALHHDDDRVPAVERLYLMHLAGFPLTTRGSSFRSRSTCSPAPAGCRWCGCRSACATWPTPPSRAASRCRRGIGRICGAGWRSAFRRSALVVVFYLMVAKPA